MNTVERIKEEARQNARGWLEVQTTCAIDSYERGAKSERNKAIEEFYQTLDQWLQDEQPAPSRAHVMIKISNIRKSLRI